MSSLIYELCKIVMASYALPPYGNRYRPFTFYPCRGAYHYTHRGVRNQGVKYGGVINF